MFYAFLQKPNAPPSCADSGTGMLLDATERPEKRAQTCPNRSLGFMSGMKYGPQLCGGLFHKP